MATYTGTSGNDTLTGVGLADDIFEGLGGDDTIDGGDGIDKAIYSGNASDYSVTYNAATDEYRITDNRTSSPDGVDVLQDIEQIEFGDGTLIEGGDPLVAADSIIEVPVSGTADWKLTGSGGFGNLVYSIDGVSKTTTHNGDDYYQLTTAAGATVKVFTDGTYEYDATSTQGQDSFTYTVTDEFGISTTATVHVGVGQDVQGETEIGKGITFDGVDDKLTSTFSEVGDDQTTWTWSGWVKRDGLDVTQTLWEVRDDGSNYSFIRFDQDDTIRVSAADGGTVTYRKNTTTKIEDTDSWHHITVSVDTNKAPTGDWVEVTIDGVLESSYTNVTNPSTGYKSLMNSARDHLIGGSDANVYYEGSMADIHFIDGQALGHTSFTQLDSNGNLVGREFDGTYGKNGFRLDFSDENDLGSDVSGNDNDFTVTSAPQQIEDIPQDAFATLDPSNATLGEGSTIASGDLQLRIDTQSSYFDGVMAKQVVTDKSYWEVTVTDGGNDAVSGQIWLGVLHADETMDTNQHHPGGAYGADSIGIGTGLRMKRDEVLGTDYPDVMNDGDVMMFAYDNGSLWIGRNGNWFGGGDPEAGTNAVATGITHEVIPAVAGYQAWPGLVNLATFNFGQSIFEHGPPAGFGSFYESYDPQWTAGNDSLEGGSGDDILGGGLGDDILIGNAGDDTLNGGEGSDTASYENSTVAVTVNLDTGVHSGGDAAGDTLISIENLIGSDHVDTLTGDSGDNTIQGLDGGDTIDGGAGSNDTASFESSDEGVDITLTSGAASGTAISGGHADGDNLSGIENLIGSDFGDELRGDANDNVIYGLDHHDDIYGGDGNDTLYGGGGIDYMYGQNGTDTLYGGDNFDQMSGGSGDDTLYGGGSGDKIYGDAGVDSIFGEDGDDHLLGNDGVDSLAGGEGDDLLMGGDDGDTINGGNGSDTASYKYSDAGVWVTLSNGAASGGAVLYGYAAGDTLVDIENLTGSANYIDVLTGDDGVNVIEGLGGDDNLYGGAGNDTLEGGDGSDDLFGGAGDDTLDGGAGNADWASYYDVTGSIGVTVDLGNDGVDVGAGQGADTFLNIENLRGTVNADDLTGDSGANLFWGEDGNDTIDGAGGNDILHGSNGDDTLEGGDGADQLHGGNGDDTLDGEAGNDRLIGREGTNQLTGGAGDDTFIFGDFGATDTVTDFNTGNNKLDISAFDFADVEAVKAASNNSGLNTTITLDDTGDTVTLLGVQKEDFVSGDFIF